MQGQYRLGSSLLAQKKYQEAMKPFAKSLQLLLRDASSSESDKIDTLTQLLSVAVNLPGTTETNQCSLQFLNLRSILKVTCSFYPTFFKIRIQISSVGKILSSK